MVTSGPQALLAELAKLEALRESNRVAAGGNRQFQRFVVRGDAELRSMDRTCLDAAPVPVLLRDIGRGGVGFVAPVELEVNSTWQICFLHRDYVVGTQGIIIRHCRKVQDGVFLIGGQFCIETGLMSLLGIDPSAIRDADIATELDEKPSNVFLPPSEVA
jgi:hypothetical protein